MFSLLDIRTLVLASGITAVVLFVHMFHVQFTRKTYPGFSLWSRGCLSAGVGLVLISLRGMLPDLISIVLSGALILAYPLMINRGLALFVDRRPGVWPDVGLFLIYTAVTGWFTYGQVEVTLRIAVFSLILSYYLLRSAVLAAGPVAASLGSRNWVLIASLLAMAALFLVRGLANLLGLSQPADFMAHNQLQAVTFMLSIAGQVFSATGLISLNTQRLEKDLALAEREVTLLSGLLPICANCKRIRDGRGDWQPVEVYISNHSQAEFSHGICPQCLQDLYPEISDKVLAKVGQ